MILPGYLDDEAPLADCSSLVGDPLFWPGFLYVVGGAESAPDAFGADRADLDTFLDVLFDSRQWPVFSLPLAGTARLHVILRNFEDDEGVDYVVEPGRGGNAVEIAALEGHFRGPALSWPELINASRQPDHRFSPAARLLLLLPACADTTRPGSAVDTVIEALAAIGAQSSRREVAVELLDTGRYWQPCRWATEDGIHICEGQHAYRRRDGKLSQGELRMISQAFDPPPAP